MADRKYGITLDEQEYEVTVTSNGSGSYTVGLDGTDYPVTVRTIALDDIGNHVTGLAQTSYEHTGSQIKPALVTDGTVTENTDYSVTYGTNVEVGTGIVTVKALGNTYTGTHMYSFTITKAIPQISEHVTGLEVTSYDYTGSQIKPAVVTDGTVTETTDYTLEYGENKELGTGTVIVTGAGTYAGSNVTYTFNIVDLIGNHITGLEETSFEYSGLEIRPELVTDGKVTKGTDYTVTYQNNIEVGTGKVIVAGIGNYRSSQTFEFTITGDSSNIGTHITGLEETSYVYTGQEIKPAVVTDGTVTETTDYTVTYSNNINVGTGTAVVTGINLYNASKTLYFTITQESTVNLNSLADTEDEVSTASETDDSTDSVVESDDEEVVEKESTDDTSTTDSETDN